MKPIAILAETEEMGIRRARDLYEIGPYNFFISGRQVRHADTKELIAFVVIREEELRGREISNFITVGDIDPQLITLARVYKR